MASLQKGSNRHEASSRETLSPYIFELCMERLSQAINKEVQDGCWVLFRFRQGGKAIFQVMFADDIILFREAFVQQLRVFSDCFSSFGKASGQQLAKEKSTLFFLKNTLKHIQRRLAARLRIQRTDNLGKYLGVPIIHQWVDRNTYSSMCTVIQARMQS